MIFCPRLVINYLSNQSGGRQSARSLGWMSESLVGSICVLSEITSGRARCVVRLAGQANWEDFILYVNYLLIINVIGV